MANSIYTEKNPIQYRRGTNIPQKRVSPLHLLPKSPSQIYRFTKLRCSIDNLLLCGTLASQISSREDQEMSTRTAKVSNISLLASQQDIREFFSFSGDIVYVEMQSESEGSQVAYVTFNDTQGADTAVLLSGATIANSAVTVTYADNYELPPEVCRQTPVPLEDSAIKRAEDIVSSMLAKGFVLGKDALNTARSFDERHHIVSNASATVASIDLKFGLSEKISMGTSVMNEKMQEMDKRYQVSEITRSTLAAAEQKASTASSTIMGNHYVSTGTSWLSNAFNRVAKAAEEVTSMTREKVEKAEDEKNEIMYRERKEMVSDFAQFHLDNSFGEPATVPVTSADEHNMGRV